MLFKNLFEFWFNVLIKKKCLTRNFPFCWFRQRNSLKYLSQLHWSASNKSLLICNVSFHLGITSVSQGSIFLFNQPRASYSSTIQRKCFFNLLRYHFRNFKNEQKSRISNVANIYIRRLLDIHIFFLILV